MKVTLDLKNRTVKAPRGWILLKKVEDTPQTPAGVASAFYYSDKEENCFVAHAEFMTNGNTQLSVTSMTLLDYNKQFPTG